MKEAGEVLKEIKRSESNKGMPPGLSGNDSGYEEQLELEINNLKQNLETL